MSTLQGSHGLILLTASPQRCRIQLRLLPVLDFGSRGFLQSLRRNREVGITRRGLLDRSEGSGVPRCGPYYPRCRSVRLKRWRSLACKGLRKVEISGQLFSALSPPQTFPTFSIEPPRSSHCIRTRSVIAEDGLCRTDFGRQRPILTHSISDRHEIPHKSP
jgi:hypothetical protein